MILDRKDGRPSNPDASGNLVRSIGRDLHFFLTVILAVCLLPAFWVARMPFKIAWFGLLDAYWVGMTLRSIFVAVLMYFLAFPIRENLTSVIGHYRAQPIRLLFLALFAAAMIWEKGWGRGFILVVDLIALAELFDRLGNYPDEFGRKMRAVFIPAAYFFVGLVLVFSYNDVVVSLKNPASYSLVFNSLDQILLGGWTVSQIAHTVMPHLPLITYGVLEFVYFGILAQVGAALIFAGYSSGKKRAFAFVGTVLTAYYLSLAVFFLWPSMSPFSTCLGHFSRFPSSLEIYNVQKFTLLKARLLWTHAVPLEVNTDYFIAFPCMHIVLPLIVLWFMQKWKRIAIALVLYDVILVAAIILLEQHYFVDLIGGTIVAILALLIVSPNPSQFGVN